MNLVKYRVKKVFIYCSQCEVLDEFAILKVMTMLVAMGFKNTKTELAKVFDQS